MVEGKKKTLYILICKLQIGTHVCRESVQPLPGISSLAYVQILPVVAIILLLYNIDITQAGVECFSQEAAASSANKGVD